VISAPSSIIIEPFITSEFGEEIVKLFAHPE
jgi:hypothetical protein